MLHLRIKPGYVSVSVINIGDGRQIPNVILIALFKTLLNLACLFSKCWQPWTRLKLKHMYTLTFKVGSFNWIFSKILHFLRLPATPNKTTKHKEAHRYKSHCQISGEISLLDCLYTDWALHPHLSYVWSSLWHSNHEWNKYPIHVSFFFFVAKLECLDH